jgi:hypothetical protein
VTPEDIARHEGAHAAMAVTLGVPVKFVGLDQAGGYVEYEPHSHTPEGAARRMMIILAAIIETAATADDLPEWPIDPDDGPAELRHDRHLLAELSLRLELDESEYRHLVTTTLKITCTDAYRHLVEAVTGGLDFTPRIDADLLHQLDTIAGDPR